MHSTYKQGDIILVPYPFTDLTETKQRPVIIISKDSANKGNFIVAKITSVIRGDEFSFSLNECETTPSMPKISEVRTNEILTIYKTIIRKKLSRLSKLSFKELSLIIKDNISVEE